EGARTGFDEGGEVRRGDGGGQLDRMRLVVPLAQVLGEGAADVDHLVALQQAEPLMRSEDNEFHWLPSLSYGCRPGRKRFSSRNCCMPFSRPPSWSRKRSWSILADR